MAATRNSAIDHTAAEADRAAEPRPAYRPEARSGGQQTARPRRPLSGQATVEPAAAMALHKTAFTDKRSGRIYRNHRRYQVVIIGERAELTLRDNAEGMSQEQLVLASHTGVVFDHIRQAYPDGGHCKGKTLHRRLSQKYFNIPRRVVDLFVETCAACQTNRPHPRKAKAGSRPILSKGKFGARGRVDLVDYQSSEYAGYKFLLTYFDHGLKLGFTAPLPNKQDCLLLVLAMLLPRPVMAAMLLQAMLLLMMMPLLQALAMLLPRLAMTAMLLLRQVLMQVLPLLLRSRGAAGTAPVAGPERMSTADVADVIAALKDPWPGCTMVNGRPRHSPSNGGSERFYRTIVKIRIYCAEHNTPNWPSASQIATWQDNTGFHSAIQQPCTVKCPVSACHLCA
eukprot:jgi/Tetstr1/464674/TSEL_009427.t2